MLQILIEVWMSMSTYNWKSDFFALQIARNLAWESYYHLSTDRSHLASMTRKTRQIAEPRLILNKPATCFWIPELVDRECCRNGTSRTWRLSVNILNDKLFFCTIYCLLVSLDTPHNSSKSWSLEERIRRITWILWRVTFYQEYPCRVRTEVNWKVWMFC